MRRRELIALAATALTALPFAAPAQQPLPVIGYLSSASGVIPNERVGVFVKALKAAGFEDDIPYSYDAVDLAQPSASRAARSRASGFVL